MLAAITVDRGVFSLTAAVASSHNGSAERQFRFPLEYGAIANTTAQTTVTGAGAVYLTKAETNESGTFVAGGMYGIVCDNGIKDASNMGAAMAPAAANTLLRFFAESGSTPKDYDLIVTGDLGYEGGDILCSLMQAEGYAIDSVYNDCGRMIYERKKQDVHGGGSGCGCSAVVLSADVLPKVKRHDRSFVCLSKDQTA